MNKIERLIRRIAMGIIAIFLIALGAFVIASLVDGRDLWRFYSGKRLLQILAGPVAAFVALMVIILRSRKNADAGSSRVAHKALLAFGLAIVSVFRAYGRRYGRDAWVVLFLASGTWSLILLWIVAPRGGPGSACPSCGPVRLPWLLFMSALWSWLAIASWRATGPDAKTVRQKENEKQIRPVPGAPEDRFSKSDF